MKGRFFISDAISPTKGYSETTNSDKSLTKGTAKLILHKAGDQVIVLRGRIDVPSYRIDNKWSTPEIKSPIGRLMDAINRRHTKMAQTQNMIEEAKMVESWAQEYAKNKGTAGSVIKGLEFIFNSSITPAQTLLNIQKTIFGNEMMGMYHSIEDSAKYFTDANPSITSGLTFTTTIVPFIDDAGGVVHAVDYLSFVESICTGRLEKGKFETTLTKSWVEGAKVRVPIFERILTNKKGIMDALEKEWKLAREESSEQFIAVEMAANRNSGVDDKQKAPFFRYTPPVGYRPKLTSWAKGTPVDGTFSVRFGGHGILNNLLVESFSVTPSKSLINLGKGDTASSYYNVTIGLTPGYKLTTDDLREIY